MKTRFSKQELKKLYDSNMSLRDIATLKKCSEGTVWKHFVFYDIKRRERSDAMKLKTKTLEHRQKLADVRFKKHISVGINNHAWKGGVSHQRNERNITGLKYWRNSVKRRDNYVCQWCGIDGKTECSCCGIKPTLHVHHLKSWNDFPEIRLDVSNGITLCERCHRSTLRITGLIAGKSRTDNQQPSQKITNRLLEGSTVSPEETIMDTNALLERDDMTCAS